MIKRILAYLITKAGAFLSFCGVTGLCILILIGLVAKKLLAKTNEIDYSVQWVSRDNHIYFVSAYVLICILTVILLIMNYLKKSKKVRLQERNIPIDQVLEG